MNFKFSSCLGDIQVSTYPGRIIVTEPKGYVQPRINVEKHSLRHVVLNGQTTLPCIAQGHPVPSYRWRKTLLNFSLFHSNTNDFSFFLFFFCTIRSTNEIISTFFPHHKTCIQYSNKCWKWPKSEWKGCSIFWIYDDKNETFRAKKVNQNWFAWLSLKSKIGELFRIGPMQCIKKLMLHTWAQEFH